MLWASYICYGSNSPLINEVATWLYSYNNLSKYSIILVRYSLLSECRLCMVYAGWIFSNWGTAGTACVVMGRAGFLRQRCRGIHTVAVWYCPIFYTGDVHVIIGSSKRFWMFGVSSYMLENTFVMLQLQETHSFKLHHSHFWSKIGSS